MNIAPSSVEQLSQLCPHLTSLQLLIETPFPLHTLNPLLSRLKHVTMYLPPSETDLLTLASHLPSLEQLQFNSNSHSLHSTLLSVI